MSYLDSLERRLVGKLDRPNDGCWLFTGVLDAGGYGLLWDARRRNNSKAHRIAYEVWVGDIPAGCDVHHRCHQRACCNPMHLEAIPSADHNSMHHLRDACAQGHPFPRPVVLVGGQQLCRPCAREACRRYRERRRAA